MSCPYYWWDNHYACRKSHKDVNEDIYYKYCQNYDYSDCPIYKGNDTSGCFITSACVEALGLPDDCYELETLRAFRDGYVKLTESGREEICEYYHTAPAIVEKIKSGDTSQAVFNKIYRELVQPCVKMIEENRHEEAYGKYRAYLKMLQKQYL